MLIHDSCIRSSAVLMNDDDRLRICYESRPRLVTGSTSDKLLFFCGRVAVAYPAAKTCWLFGKTLAFEWHTWISWHWMWIIRRPVGRLLQVGPTKHLVVIVHYHEMPNCEIHSSKNRNTSSNRFVRRVRFNFNLAASRVQTPINSYSFSKWHHRNSIECLTNRKPVCVKSTVAVMSHN